MVMRYEDVIALGMFSLGPTAVYYKTHEMMIETRLRTRGNHDQEESFGCCVNSGMREDTFSAQELKEWLAFGFWKMAI